MWAQLATSCMVGTAFVLANSVLPAAQTSDRKSESIPIVTVDKQGLNEHDFEVTRLIRQNLIADGELSTQAHNVKIITKNGRVVLQGPLPSIAEKKIVEIVAKNIAGQKSVLNRTTVQRF